MRYSLAQGVREPGRPRRVRARGARESAPTWALVRNPGGEPAHVRQRADELPVSARTIVGGQALAPLSALGAHRPPPGPIASLHGFSMTVISRPERGQSREALAHDAEQCRQTAGMAPRGAAAPGVVTAQSSGVLVDGEVVSFPGAAESSAIRSYSGCMNQRGYSVTEWSGRVG
jgi:hypothetical protein